MIKHHSDKEQTLEPTLDVTALAFAQIINMMRETGLWKTDWIVISSEKATGQDSCNLFTVCHALKTFTPNKVVTQFRLTQDKKLFEIQKLSKYY